tara:strand:- start:393 stop:818 length:426 start_codon:yes stop_codon:yes gene_type:complete
MSTFDELNTYSQTTVDYAIPQQSIALATATGAFTAPIVNWEMVRTLGALTGLGVNITVDVSASTGAVVTFPNSSLSNNTLTVTNPSTGVYTISGILDVIDFVSAQATITPDAGNSADVDYDVVYANDNSSGTITVDYLGVV